jgi:flavin reductase (DIM6/NTAB) family NADH-FMN oxidoreductase RutF
MSAGADAANELFAELDYPMFIVTVADGEDVSGCLVGFATQTSIHPPRFLVCLSDKNHTYRVARRVDLLIVHLVPADQAGLAELFGGETGDEVDKFARVAWHPGPGGAPVLEACGNWFAGRILDRVPAGDHEAYLLDPVEAHVDRLEGQFEFHRAKAIAPGHDA